MKIRRCVRRVPSVSAIYLQLGDEFVAMHERAYDAEALLQALLADHPEILVGEEEGDGRGWILVKREAGVADREGASDRWSLDHLFLDAEGVPTLVEVKRSSDTRARREVVAQMLDYAANAIAFWKVESLQAWFEAECERGNIGSAAKLETACGVTDPDSYWDMVRTNLAADRIRLVFVADEIAPELRSIVEFLNRQMSETEVLAIEVKQYVDAEGQRQTIVPRLVGRTEAARAAKGGSGRSSREWDEPSVLAEISRRHGDAVATIARSLIAWAEAHQRARVVYGKGARDGSAGIRLDHDGASLHAFNVWTSPGSVEIPFDFMGSFSQAPFAERRSARDELRRRINEAVPGAKIPTEEQRPRPSFSLNALGDEQARQRFLDAIEWAFDQARQAQSPPTDAGGPST
jgi:hypothetical protein